MTSGPLPLRSSREIIGALERLGAWHVRTRGSHATYARMTPSGRRITQVVLGKREIPRGTLRAILAGLEIPVEVFRQAL